MTQDQIAAWADAVGAPLTPVSMGRGTAAMFSAAQLERFAALVAAAERESRTRRNSSRGLVVVALSARPLTRVEIDAVTGVSHTTSKTVLRLLRKAGRVHICGWANDYKGRLGTPIYMLGPGEDAPRVPTRQAARQRRRPKALPDVASRSVFVGGHNPWAGA